MIRDIDDLWDDDEDNLGYYDDREFKSTQKVANSDMRENVDELLEDYEYKRVKRRTERFTQPEALERGRDNTSPGMSSKWDKYKI